jgi:hypothetical protein
MEPGALFTREYMILWQGIAIWQVAQVRFRSRWCAS